MQILYVIINTKYHSELTSQRLILEEGIIYQLEQPKATRLRQLQRKVVPTTLRTIILAAYHATLLAGHTGVYKTYWRIAARFWKPEMSKDVRRAVLYCAHCIVANTASHHQAQQILGALSMHEPFDIISMDAPRKNANEYSNDEEPKGSTHLPLQSNWIRKSCFYYTSNRLRYDGTIGILTLLRTQRTTQTGNY